MGITGTDVARESADMILMDDNFASIVNGIEEGRSVFDNLQKFNVYVFTHNWAELATFIAFVLLQTPLPLAIVGILLIDLVLDIPPSLALTLEPPEPGIMERPPRKKENRLFNIKSLARSGYIGLFIGSFALVWCFYAWSQTGWSIGQPSMTDYTAYLKGTTMVIVGIMAGQLGMLIATRTNIKSTFSVSLRHNKWLLIAILIELLILFSVVYIPFFSPVFNTISLQPLDWIFLYSIVPENTSCLRQLSPFIASFLLFQEKLSYLRKKKYHYSLNLSNVITRLFYLLLHKPEKKISQVFL